MKINDVAELVGVSASTLRYWEKKLDLDVPRDGFGSRTFTTEWVEYFKQVKALLDEDLGWDEIGKRLEQPRLPVDDEPEPPTVEPPATPPDEPEPPKPDVPTVDLKDFEKLKTEVGKLARSLDQAEQKFKEQNKTIARLQADFESLQGSHDDQQKGITGLQEQVKGLQAALEPLQGLQKRFWWWIIGVFVVFFFTMVAVVEGLR